MGYTDEELEVLLLDHESDLAERKESWQGDVPQKARQAVCAFANDLPDHRRPGVLFVGVRDDGVPSGLEITDRLLQSLSDMRSDGNILPSPFLVVEKRVLRGRQVAVVTVEPALSPPVRFRGQIWVRVGPRRALATSQEERILNEKRRYGDLPFDLQSLPTCPLAALDERLFLEEYLPGAVAPSVLAANERSTEQKLASCRMVASASEPVPTVLGILALGVSPRDWIPGAYVQFLRIGGDKLSDPIRDEAVLDGPLVQMLRRLDEKLEAHNGVEVDLVSAVQEIRRPTYPREALQQLARNAVMHRTYECTHAPVRVTWFDDRIEIGNPGGPYGVVNRENFGRPGVTDYRNPHLAEALKVLGFVQRFGVGIQVARKALEENGNPPPEFQVEPTSVLVTVRRRP